ncbi:hypothetical protein JOB18_033527 [Solea senegalensis]|uniref:Uncharacterized protein n=1 Tax=Solea senegalensis TaxID=28829 RepID=A0AAV6R2D5_SOLSE|nr:hypothetical protein JOB18_033527 [Solea senegalensis]
MTSRPTDVIGGKRVDWLIDGTCVPATTDNTDDPLESLFWRGTRKQREKEEEEEANSMKSLRAHTEL